MLLALIAAFQINIPAGPAPERINDLFKDMPRPYQFQVVYDYGDMSPIRTHEVQGNFTSPFDALQRLIEGLPITFAVVNNRTLTFRLCDLKKPGDCLPPCAPALSWMAPLPPCKPPVLTIKPPRLTAPDSDSPDRPRNTRRLDSA